MTEATHGITIVYNGANPDVQYWLEKIRSQANHPQYQGDIVVGAPYPLDLTIEDE